MPRQFGAKMLYLQRTMTMSAHDTPHYISVKGSIRQGKEKRIRQIRHVHDCGLRFGV